LGLIRRLEYVNMLDTRLLAGVGIPRCVRHVLASDKPVSNEKDPKLLERRINARPTAENELTQKIIQSSTSLAFVSMLVASALITASAGPSCLLPQR
jgi:hypothetical protein